MTPPVSDPNPNKDKGFQYAYRLGMEFTSGILVGVLIGYFIDKWLDTAPWGMVGFIFLGSAAGFLNIYRLVVMMKPGDNPSKDEGND